MKPLPKWGMMLMTVASATIYLGLAIWGWHGWSAIMAHPARAGAVVVTVVVSVAALFTNANISGGRREDTKNRWIFLPVAIISFILGWLPAYTDRREILSIDGDVARYLGLTLYAVGCVLRVAPVFVLGRRFSGLVAIQEGHELVTRGLYRVIRHPSYLGLLITVLGWALVFRSAIGVLVSLLLLPPLVARMNSEEALLESEFGERYSAYRRHTWRLLPFLY
ncbi:MAG: isoprenylcysteine carboxylmethyltransferase family protein [Isosphaeraceae bacterium]|nr:isoprenylcysteine carboxylmethyltransferase family protein [Isosphaeraceae bacterium]